MVVLLLAVFLCCGADQLSEGYHSSEDDHPRTRAKVSSSDPLEADIVCKARCMLECFTNNTMGHWTGQDCISACNKYNSTWLTEECTTAACQASCGNLTQGLGSRIERPFLQEVTLDDNKLVLNWQSVNCTSCQRQDIVSIIRYSSNMEEWNYKMIVENHTFSLDLQGICAKHFQVGLVSQFGVSLPSDMRTLRPIQVIKDEFVTVQNTPTYQIPHLVVRLSWQLTSGWIPETAFFLNTLSTKCQVQQRDPSLPILSTHQMNITNRTVTTNPELARGNCNVEYQLQGTFGACYEIKPVNFSYTYVCKEILDRQMSGNCPPNHFTPTLDDSSINVTFYGNMTAKVEWRAIEAGPHVKVYGYIVQWGVITRTDLFLKLKDGTTKDISVPGVANDSVWLTDLQPGTDYGVKLAVNMSGADINLAMMKIVREFRTEESSTEVTSPRSRFILTNSPSAQEAPTDLIIPAVVAVVAVLFLSAVAMVIAVAIRTCSRCHKESHLSKPRLQRNESTANIYSITPATESPDPPTCTPDHWEIAFERLEMGEVLGKGQFGVVMKAFIAGKLSTQHTSGSSLFRDSIKRYDLQVAVKMLHSDADEMQQQEFRREMKLMKDIGHHCNLVSLLGCCSIDTTPLCLIVEHCCHGDLLGFLRANRDVMMRSEAAEKSEDIVADFLTPNDLVSFARQIARGMEYLSQKGFVHRDLAARNVMVAEEKTVKIGDFGLTRYVYDDKIYVHRRGGKLPIKWMSLESLYDQVFTTCSDVWSFGVLLFELVTLGASPYPGISNREILYMLKRGDRMQRPENCSEVLYAIMIACWHPCPDERPTFTHLRNKLEALLEEDTPYLDFSQNYSCFPFFEISEESESEEEEVEEAEGEFGSGAEEIPMVSMEGGHSDKLDTVLSSDEVFVELESSQLTLDAECDAGWHDTGRQDEDKVSCRDLQKRDSGLGSDYLYSSRHMNMEDVPLV